MSTPAVAVTACLIGLYVVAAVWLCRRERRRPLQRDRIIREARERTGLAEVDELELLYSLPAYDPAWEAGMERLWNAVRDNQNQPRGDQQ